MLIQNDLVASSSSDLSVTVSPNDGPQTLIQVVSDLPDPIDGRSHYVVSFLFVYLFFFQQVEVKP